VLHSETAGNRTGSSPSNPDWPADERDFLMHARITTQCLIEPGLRPASPENGNIRGVSQRLSPNSVLIPRNREHRDGTTICERPPLAGLSATIGGIFPEPQTAWLGREDSNLRMVESKSTALPLGDAPITCLESGGTIAARIPSGNARSIEGVEPFQQARTAIRPESAPRFCLLIMGAFFADRAGFPRPEKAPPPCSITAQPTHRGVAAPPGS
jgi:hypothetical protein